MPDESTTPDLLELARRYVEAASRRDFDAVEGFYAPDVVFRGAELGTYEGRAAARGVVEDICGPYEEFRAETEDIRDIGFGIIFAVVVARGRFVGSSAEVRFRFASVAIWTEGLLAQITNYIDVDEARAAAEHLAEERGQATPQKNIELVQAAFDAYFRGDESAMLDHAAPDVVVTQFPDQPDVQDYHGHEGLLQVMAEWTGIWDDWSVEILRTREIGDSVLVAARQRGRGKSSGAHVEGEVAFVFTVRRDKIARWQMFHSEQQALEAIGLEQ